MCPRLDFQEYIGKPGQSYWDTDSEFNVFVYVTEPFLVWTNTERMVKNLANKNVCKQSQRNSGFYPVLFLVSTDHVLFLWAELLKNLMILKFPISFYSAQDKFSGL